MITPSMSKTTLCTLMASLTLLEIITFSPQNTAGIDRARWPELVGSSPWFRHQEGNLISDILAFDPPAWETRRNLSPPAISKEWCQTTQAWQSEDQQKPNCSWAQLVSRRIHVRFDSRRILPPRIDADLLLDISQLSQSVCHDDERPSSS